MNRDKAIRELRIRRGYRVRKSVRGTAERPRLSVFRSNKHVYCQLIDDQAGKTLVSASTRLAIPAIAEYLVVGLTAHLVANTAALTSACFHIDSPLIPDD